MRPRISRCGSIALIYHSRRRRRSVEFSNRENRIRQTSIFANRIRKNSKLDSFDHRDRTRCPCGNREHGQNPSSACRRVARVGAAFREYPSALGSTGCCITVSPARPQDFPNGSLQRAIRARPQSAKTNSRVAVAVVAQLRRSAEKA